MISTNSAEFAKIQDILEQLDHQLADKGKDNRRRASRVCVRIPLAVILPTGLAPTSVDIISRNISVSGMGFVSRRLFKLGERIVVTLKIANAPAKLILAQITFAQYLRGGLYQMGAEFLESVNDTKGEGTYPRHWQIAGSVVKHDDGPHEDAPPPAVVAAAPLAAPAPEPVNSVVGSGEPKKV